MVLCVMLWYVAIVCSLLPTAFEKATLQYWHMILLLPASLIRAWQMMSFSGSSPSSLFPGGGELGYLALRDPSCLCAASCSSRQPSAEQPPVTSSTSSMAPCSCSSPHCYSHSIFEGFFSFCLLAWHLLVLLILEPLLSGFFFFWSFCPSAVFPLPWWLSLWNILFSASWASFVWSQTKALHHCSCYAGAYTVGSCHTKYQCPIKFPWGSFLFQSLSLYFSKAAVSKVCPPVFSQSYFISLILHWIKILSLLLGER